MQNVWGILAGWILCIILTAAGVFPDDPNAVGFRARSDVRLDALQQAAWFYVPYPGTQYNLKAAQLKTERPVFL